LSAAVLLLAALGSCSFLGMGRKSQQVLKRPAAEGTEIVEMSVSRGKYKNALEQPPPLNLARMVQMFGESGGQSNPYPEYRIFDVRPGSVYTLLGLRERDEILAASGYVIGEQGMFSAFLNLLPVEKEGSLLVRRGGREKLFKYTFTD